MNKEEKELLIKDLCGRLPYGVVVHFEGWNPEKLTQIDLRELVFNDMGGIPKPYLRPLSSMTEEEYDDMFHQLYSAQEEFFRNCSNTDTIGKLIANDGVRYDWLDKKMFDHRGLIPKGLALEAPEGMYN